MKKITRLLSLFLVFGICLSLCGCNALDDLRVSRASLITEDVIRLSDGAEYKRLPECEEFYPDWGKSKTLYVVENDLPLLLTIFGDSVKESEDGRFLMVNNEYYCHTDLYGSLYDRIQNGFTPEIYGYSYFSHQNSTNMLYELTPVQAEAINQVCATQEPEKLPIIAKLDYDYKANLYLYSADYLFRQDTVDIYLTEDTYFLVANSNIIYTVPEELSPVFEEIMANAVENYFYGAD